MDLLKYAEIKPAVNQIELHPYLSASAFSPPPSLPSPSFSPPPTLPPSLPRASPRFPGRVLSRERNRADRFLAFRGLVLH
jgi:hypothetical protein